MHKIAYWISLVFIFSIPWEGIILIEGFGALGRVIGFLLAGIWGLSVLVTKRIRTPQSFHAIFSLFILWHIMSIFWSIDFGLTTSRIQAYIQLVPMIYIIWDIYTTPKAIKNGLQAYVLGVYMTIFSLVSNFLAGDGFYYYRFSATGFDVNNTAIILALGIPLAWYLATSENDNKFKRLFKIINYSYIPIAIFAILLTGSRAGMITTSFAMLYVISGFFELKLSRILVMGLLIIAVSRILPLVPIQTLERLGTAGSSIGSLDLNGRYSIWTSAIYTFSDHPILGIGSFAFRSASEIGKLAHNTFLNVLVEVGLIGFGLFAVLMIITFFKALDHKKPDRFFWLTIFVTLMIGVFSLNWAHRKHFWLFPSLIVTSASLTVQDHGKLTSKSDQDENNLSVEQEFAEGHPITFIPNNIGSANNFHRKKRLYDP